MRRAVIVGTLCLCLHVLVQAQQAGSNVGVLPVVTNPSDPNAFLKGDAYLQRQLEPSIGVSTRNPQTVIAFFNDYRAVDVPTDVSVGEGNPESMSTLLAWVKPLSRMLGRVVGITPKARPTPVAAAEAWVGMSRSYDGGRTWIGGFLPGASFDGSAASLASPIRGAAAATDPVVASGPCGQFYVGFIAFTRGADSHLAVARYVDNNNHEGGENITYLGTTVIDNSLNSSQGQFLDKPSIAVDIARGAAAGGCAQTVYVAYTQFTGKSGNKFQSSIIIARSTDGGVTFTKQKISNSYPENQGTAVAVDPRPGTPTTTGGGTVYVIWRHFFDPDAMVAQKSTDYGATWLGKGVRITPDTMQKFDQPTLATTAVGPADLAFRSNAFPTATVTPTGVLLAAWQERVDVTSGQGSPTFGFPAANGSPRIVLTTSANGTTWTARKAIDFGDRDGAGSAPEPGLGFLPQSRPSGPQVMPSLSAGGGKVMLAYYESRGFFQTSPEQINVADVTGQGNYIAGLDRLMDVRAAVLNPSTGALQGTAQVSRYPLKAWANKVFGGAVVDELKDVLPVSAPCSPDFGANFPPCIRHVNRVNVPHSAQGTSPFIGDYIYLTPAVQFVKDGTGWRWATSADVPEAGFHVAFADNRNQIPATQLPAGATSPLDAYKLYAPPQGGGSCVNPGSRNTDVITSRVSAQLVVSAPTTYKQLGTITRAFPLTVSNGTGFNKFYRLTITAGAANASFSQNADLDGGDVQLFPYSSTTRVVYVSPTATGLITIAVQEIDAYGGNLTPNGLTGTATINADSSNPAVSFGDLDTETHNPFVQNPFVQNPFVQNPFVQNGTVLNPFVQNTSPSNPFVQNPFVQNPFVQNVSPADVVDTTWTVQNAGNTTSTYLASVNVDNAAAYVGNYAFQLIIWKQSSNGTLTACDPSAQGQAEILANLVQDPTQQNPFVQNPFVQNPFVQNPFVQNPFVQNATFAVAPADSTQTAPNPAGLRTLAATAPTTDDGTLKQPRPQDEVKVTLRAFKINPNSPITFDPRLSPPSLAVVAHSNNIVNGVLQDTPVGFTAPDLILTGGIGASPGTKAAGVPFTFPAAGFAVTNQGNADGAAVDHTIRYGVYLSTDATITPADRLIGYVETTNAPVLTGTTQTFAGVNVTVPLSVPSGNYYIGVYIDDQLEVSELNETNNSLSVPITIDTPSIRTISLAKTIASGSPYAAVGNVITYNYLITNTGNVTLNGPASVSDNKASVTCPAGNLAVGQSVTCTGSYAVTQADLDAGSVTNTATATVDAAVSSQATATATATVTRGLSLTKGAAPTTYNALGQAITYSYTVRNTGNVTLSGPFTVTDDHITGPIACGSTSLAPNATTTCTANYTITQANLDAGTVTNTATASNGTVTSAQAQATVTAVQTRSVSLVKSITGGNPYAAVGAVVSYSYLVTNTGNVTLAGPATVADNKATVTCPAGALAPLATVTCTAAYAVTQADLDAGSVTNTATATVNGIVSNQAQATANATQTRSVGLVKTVTGGSPYAAVGSLVNYSYVVTNTGNVTLAGPATVADNKTTVTCPAGSLAPAGSKTCTASYAVTQADLDAGSVTNTATATVNGIASNQAQATATATQTRSVGLVKTVTSGSPYAAVGSVVNYSYVVTNTGNVTLAGPATVADNKTTVTCPAGALAPLATVTCTAAYAVTQADLDAGSVTNTATATVNGIGSSQAQATATATQNRSVSLVKSITSGSPYAAVGNVIGYSYVVTNTGNVTLAGPATVADNKTTVTCPAGALAPAASVTCTASYAVTQSDLDLGSVTNSATATVNGIVSNEDHKTATATQTRALSLAKTANPTSYNTVGQLITYSYTVRNTGNVTVSGPFTVADDHIALSIACGAGPLAPNATSTCTAIYAVTQADLDAGSVTNIARASNGTVTSPFTQATVTAQQIRTLGLVKTASPTGYNAAGQVITYTYAVTNTGNVTLSGTVAISDDKLGAFTCVASTVLAPSGSASCTKPYTIVQADVTNGSVTNTATATIGTVTSSPASATVTLTLVNGMVSGGKYYDGLRNGIKDGIDPGYAGWKIDVKNNTTLAVTTLTTAADGSFSIVLPPGSYTFQEKAASNGDWTQTGNTSSQASIYGPMSVTLDPTTRSYTVVLPASGLATASGLNFGNACAVIPGGQGIGFWGNKNSAKLITAADLQALVALPLVKDDGTAFDPTSVAQFQSWINISANGQNMADQLSGQLAAMVLNLRHGYTKPNASIDGYRTTTQEVTYASSLIQADSYTASGDPNRVEQSRVQAIFNNVNSGQKFLQTIPDACAAPIWP